MSDQYKLIASLLTTNNNNILSVERHAGSSVASCGYRGDAQSLLIGLLLSLVLCLIRAIHHSQLTNQMKTAESCSDGWRLRELNILHMFPSSVRSVFKYRRVPVSVQTSASLCVSAFFSSNCRETQPAAGFQLVFRFLPNRI